MSNPGYCPDCKESGWACTCRADHYSKQKPSRTPTAEPGEAEVARVGSEVHGAMVYAVNHFKGEPQPWQNGNSHAEHHARTVAEGIIAALGSTTPASDEPFQVRVGKWMEACFTPAIIADKLERSDRFIEEALELVQATGYSAERAHALVDYVFNRPVGEPFQEVGGVMVTLAALCNPHGLDMDAAAETELARIMAPEVIEKIRAKQASKPVGSALPVPAPAVAVDDDALVELVHLGRHWPGDPITPFEDESERGKEYCRRIARLVSAHFAARLRVKDEALTLRPLETSPKDGSYFLIVGTNFDGGMAVVCWDDGQWYLDDGKNFEIPLRHESKLTGWLPLPALSDQPGGVAR